MQCKNSDPGDPQSLFPPALNPNTAERQGAKGRGGKPERLRARGQEKLSTRPLTGRATARPAFLTKDPAVAPVRRTVLPLQHPSAP